EVSVSARIESGDGAHRTMSGTRMPTNVTNVSRGKKERMLRMAAVDPRRPDNIDVEVGRLVRVQRIARGLSQTELGNQIGATFQQVQQYESGAHRISMGRLTRISRVLGVDITYLLGASRRSAPATAVINPKDQAKFSEAVGMLGKIGALRLLKAFNAIPKKP